MLTSIPTSIWADFDDAHETDAIAAVEAVLAELAPIDLMEILPHSHPKIRQRIYHLAGTVPYLMIDFCWQCHSRDYNETALIEGNLIENAKVLFDKSNVVHWKPYDAADYADAHAASLTGCIYRYGQHSRVLKYVRRGLYLEAYAYYHRYVLEPLIDLLRLIYTPAHTDYYLIHISQHIPPTVYERLTYFAQITTLDDIEARTNEARAWFDVLHTQYIALDK